MKIKILNTSDCENGITRCKSKQHKKAIKNLLGLTCPEKYFLSKMNEDLLKVSNSLIFLYLECSKKV